MIDEELPEDNDDELFEHHRIVADAKQGLIRIDKFLMDRLPNVTRTKIQHGIHDGFVKVNDKSIKPNYKVHPNDVITVSFPEPPRITDVMPENIPLNIVYEDEQDKKSHPGYYRAGHQMLRFLTQFYLQFHFVLQA